jgi:glycolate oxidase iron-sulfur subunit
MQTEIAEANLQDPSIARANRILRSCVHCGLCIATCPTYVLLGDERDSPRGRIYLIKDMFEKGEISNAVTHHVDRCLSCLSCMTTCPSGVDYMHLVDLARAHIEKSVKRPMTERITRWTLREILPHRRRFQLMLFLGWLARPLRGVFKMLRFKRAAATLDLVHRRPHLKLGKRKAVFRPDCPPVKRVALLRGCVQQVLQPTITRSAIRLLRRHGVEVITLREEVCCGALVHHLGQEEAAREAARHNIDIWSAAMRETPIDAILTTASGCGTMVKDYGDLLARDKGYAERAAEISAHTRDIAEFMDEIGLEVPHMWSGLRVAYHAACSLQHGQRVSAEPRSLLSQAGFSVLEIPESHICCGSAGTYNILQPELAQSLRERKLENIDTVQPDVVAAGNIGCIVQLTGKSGPPIVHTVELLDWATGGPCPRGLEHLSGRVSKVASLVEETVL